jgi:hypothetical protein
VGMPSDRTPAGRFLTELCTLYPHAVSGIIRQSSRLQSADLRILRMIQFLRWSGEHLPAAALLAAISGTRLNS